MEAKCFTQGERISSAALGRERLEHLPVSEPELLEHSPNISMDHQTTVDRHSSRTTMDTVSQDGLNYYNNGLHRHDSFITL